MKILLNKSLNFEVLTIEDDGSVIIHDHFFKVNMQTQGVDIPAFLQDAYHHQDKVKLGDPLFAKAFQEVYWPMNMNPENYVWAKRVEKS